MKLLRIYAPLDALPRRCTWSLIEDGRQPLQGEGSLSSLPRGADRVQLLIPAAQVFLTRARLPAEARRQAGSLLAFAIEEQLAGDPDASQVIWVASAPSSGPDTAQETVLAAIDREGLGRWRAALLAAGIAAFEVQAETLLLPLRSGEWSLAWNGREGILRSGEWEGFNTDRGDSRSPPLALVLALEEARTRNSLPAALAVFAESANAPDTQAWQQALGIPLRMTGAWLWQDAPASPGLLQERRRWHRLPELARRLRPAAWILASAAALHGLLLVVDWARLAHEQRQLRQSMEARFRGAFPEAVAVVDPALQMRRKLAEARHGAGQADSGDFLPLLGKVAAGLADLSPGSVRAISFDSGRMTLDLATLAPQQISTITSRLAQAGLAVDAPGKNTGPGAVITVRSP